MAAKYLKGIKPSALVTPEVLGAVSQVESSNNPNAVGPMTKYGRALGQYQILPSTAADMGIDPMDPVQAKQGASDYLSWLVGETGDLKSAIEAYHAGLGTWKKSGGKSLGPETIDYTKKIMALLAKHEAGETPTVASAPNNPQDPTPQQEAAPIAEAAPPDVKAPASLASGPSPGKFSEFQNYEKISSPPSQFMGKDNPITMVESLLRDPMALSRGEGRNMAGGGLIKGGLSRLAKMLGPDEVPKRLQPLQAVKEQGGQWLPGSAQEFARSAAEGRGREALTTAIDPAKEWVDKALPKYIERYMGAKGDPLADVMIPHGDEGMKRWEQMTDPLVRKQTAGSVTGKIPDWLRALDEDTPVHSMYEAKPEWGNMRYAGPVQNYIAHTLDYAATLPPEKLKQYDFPRLVKEVQKIDAERAKKMASVEGRAEGTIKHKEYPTGFHWAEVQSPEALKREGDIMGHCVGGYCDDVKAGKKKIYSLRDPKGESHATVEVASPDPGRLGRELDGRNLYNRASSKVAGGKHPTVEQLLEFSKEEAPDLFEKYSKPLPDLINQIKGKQNLAPKPEYQQYIQDLIRSGKYGEVRDLENAGLMRMRELQGHDFDGLREKYKDYVSKQEIDDYLKSIQPGIPQMKDGGEVLRAPPQNRILGALSRAAKGVDEFTKPARDIPYAGWLVPSFESLGGVLEDASYGMPLTTGKGMTTGLKSEVGFAALDASQLPGLFSVAKLLGKRAANGLRRAKLDVAESMFGPEEEYALAKAAWDKAHGYAGGGLIKGGLSRLAKMLGADEVPKTLAPLQAVKEQGGQWLPGSSQEFARSAAEGRGRAPLTTAVDPAKEWAEKAIPKYIERYMGAKGDPLADVMIPHGNGMRRWEEMTDPLVAKGQKSYLMRPEHPEWLKNLPPETELHSLIGNTSPARPVQDYISHVLDHAATTPPEKLKQYDFPRLVQEVQKIDAERAKKMASVEGRAEGTIKHKEYPTGFHWAEVQSREALKREGDIMGHCVGGYCDDVKAGRKKIYSLRDPKGESHATVEVVPTPIGNTGDLEKVIGRQKTGELYNSWYKAGGGNKEAFGDFIKREYPEIAEYANISQIKGKQNLAPKEEYQHYIQDLIRSGRYGEVRDLENSGLVSTKPGENEVRLSGGRSYLPNDSKAIRKKFKEGYATEQEIDDYLKSIAPGIPQMKKGGPVRKPCKGGMTCPCLGCSTKRFKGRK